MATRLYLKCSIPTCFNTVGQHSKNKNKNKQVCDSHRKAKKDVVDKWKMDQGCNNKDGHYNFPCVSSEILNPATLDINHIDGNNDNRDPSNIEILCKMCHTVVTLQSNHHMQPSRENRRYKFANYEEMFGDN